MIFSTFFLVYATATLHLASATAIQVSLLAGLVGLGATPLFGYVSDLVGRRRMFLTGVTSMAVFALPYWSLLNTRDVGLVRVHLAQNERTAPISVDGTESELKGVDKNEG